MTSPFGRLNAKTGRCAECGKPIAPTARNCMAHRRSQRKPRDQRLIEFTGQPDVNGCTPWTGSLIGGGYGQFHEWPKVYYAHRIAYEFYVGPIPAGLQVLHRCDNPPCVNVAHLFLGTNADNVDDRVAKARTTAKRGRYACGHAIQRGYPINCFRCRRRSLAKDFSGQAAA